VADSWAEKFIPVLGGLCWQESLRPLRPSEREIASVLAEYSNSAPEG